MKKIALMITTLFALTNIVVPSTVSYALNNIESVKVLDENIGKKSAWTSGTVIGENVYYSVYTSQITDVLQAGSSYAMKEGDILSVSVKNTNKTMAQTIRSAFYSITGNDTYQIAAQASGMVQATGSK